MAILVTVAFVAMVAGIWIGFALARADHTLTEFLTDVERPPATPPRPREGGRMAA